MNFRRHKSELFYIIHFLFNFGISSHAIGRYHNMLLSFVDELQRKIFVILFASVDYWAHEMMKDETQQPQKRKSYNRK